MSAHRRLLIRAERVLAPGLSPTPAGHAILIDGDRIAAVGPADTIRATGVTTLDLPGATIGPGLTDAHIHVTEWALSRHEVDLSAATSPEEAARAVAAAASGTTGWIRGRGWNPHRWHGAQPHRSLLDHAAPGRPVALQSHDMHSMWASGAALERANIGAHSPDPGGGRIVRDAAGEPTGLLLENAGRLVADAVPAPSVAEMRAAVLDAQAALHRYGITGVHSFPGIHVPEPAPRPILEALQAEGRLALRVLQHIALEELDEAIRARLHSGGGRDLMRTGAVKMFLDGALGSRTAWMRTSYETIGHVGIRTMDHAAFRERVRHAAAHGIAATVHAIGDAAVAMAFDVLRDGATRVEDFPHRIEHVQCCPPEYFDVPHRAGIVCSVQPCHLMTDWRAADEHWGETRAAHTYAFGSLLRRGAVLAFGSDAPVEPADPRLGLFAAVYRRDTGHEPADGWHPAEALTPAEALDGYTTGPAVAAGLAGRVGAIVPGAFADLAAWDRDPLDAGLGLLDIRCIATVVAGIVVHS